MSAQTIVMFLKSKTAKQTLFVIVSSVLVALFGSLTTIVLARKLGSENFGVYSLFFSIVAVMGGLSDFGITTSFVRFASLYLERDEKKAEAVLVTSLKIKIILSCVVSIVGVIFSAYIANKIFAKPVLFLPLKAAFLCLMGIGLFGFVQNNLRVREQFGKYSALNVFHSFVPLVIIGVLWIKGYLNLMSAIATFIAAPFLSSLFGLLLGPRDFLSKKIKSRGFRKQLFHFGKWIWLRTLCGIIFARLDIFMLTYFVAMSQVGFYAAAFGLASKLLIISEGFVTVLLPKISRLGTRQEIFVFVKKFLKISSLCVLVLLPVLFFGDLIIRLLYGESFSPAVVIFKLLFVRFLIAVITGPLFLVAYALDRPHVLAFSSGIILLLGFFLHSIFIPLYGGLGAAITLLLLAIIHPIIVFFMIRKDLFGEVPFREVIAGQDF